MTEPRRRTPRNLVNTADIALYVRKAHGVELNPATVRKWAERGRIATYGDRRERYDLREVVLYAEQVGAIPRSKPPPDAGE